MMSSNPSLLSLKRQKGASAIEFAIVFPLFFVVFYGIVCYAIILLYKQSLATITSESARAAVAAITTSAVQDQIDTVKARYAWIGEINGCGSGAQEFEYDPTNKQLDLCLTAELPTLPTISFAWLGLPSLPPENAQDMIKGRASVLWEPVN